jgi:hypothetical protein
MLCAHQKGLLSLFCSRPFDTIPNRPETWVTCVRMVTPVHMLWVYRSDSDDSWQDEVQLLARDEVRLVEGEFLPILTPSSLLPFAPRDVMPLGEHGTRATQLSGTQGSHRTVRLSLYWSMWRVTWTMFHTWSIDQALQEPGRHFPGSRVQTLGRDGKAECVHNQAKCLNRWTTIIKWNEKQRDLTTQPKINI